MRHGILVAALVLGSAFVTSAATDARAHGDAHEGIDDLSAQIGTAPDASSLPALHVQRAGLHSRDGDVDAALADLDRAAALEPGRDDLDYLRGRVLLDAGHAAEADLALSRFLAANPDHSAAQVARARARVRLGHPLAAADDFRRASARRPASPDVYLERARALRSAGPEHRPEAIAALDEGIAALGPVVGLEMLAMEFELEADHPDAALARLDRIAAASPRQETWWVRRGEILEGAGRPADAQAAFGKARLALDRLPAHRRASPAMVDLEGRIRKAQVRLASPQE